MRRQEIREAFECFVSKGSVVLLHSSLSSLGVVDGGADTVIDGMMDALGRDGTLVVPTLTGHEALSSHNPPHIDLRTEPSWTGLIGETLRKRPEAVRSVHPTHSCAAIGARAEELTRDHYLSPTPCGITSPYFRVALAQGYIVMLGCTLDTCTTFHTIEEIANLDYVCQSEVAHGTCIDRFGNTLQTPCRLHRYDGPDRDFPVMEPILRSKHAMRIERVGSAELRVINAMALIELTLDRLRFDPMFLTSARTT
jgi:aminoglycoside 3-N-acetyltransferase